MTKELAISLLEGKDVYLTEEGEKILLEMTEQISHCPSLASEN